MPVELVEADRQSLEDFFDLFKKNRDFTPEYPTHVTLKDMELLFEERVHFYFAVENGKRIGTTAIYPKNYKRAHRLKRFLRSPIETIIFPNLKGFGAFATLVPEKRGNRFFSSVLVKLVDEKAIELGIKKRKAAFGKENPYWSRLEPEKLRKDGVLGYKLGGIDSLRNTLGERYQIAKWKVAMSLGHNKQKPKPHYFLTKKLKGRKH